MNFIQTNELAGHPLTLNDLGFMQAAYQQIVRGLALGLMSDDVQGVILYGCELSVSSGKWFVSAGYVVTRSGALAEVYFVPSHDTGVPSSTSISSLRWNAKQTVSPPSPVKYKNLALKNVHFERTATLTTLASGISPLYSATPRIDQHLLDRLNADTWHMVGTAPEPLFGASWSHFSISENVQFTKRGKVVFLNLQATHASYTSDTLSTIFTLPLEYRPSIDVQFKHTISGTTTTIFIFIKTDGTVAVKATYSGALYVNMGVVSYPVG